MMQFEYVEPLGDRYPAYSTDETIGAGGNRPRSSAIAIEVMLHQNTVQCRINPRLEIALGFTVGGKGMKEIPRD